MSHTGDPLECPALELMMNLYLEPNDERVHEIAHIIGIDLAKSKPGTPPFIRSEMALILAADTVRQRLAIRKLKARIANLETQVIEMQVTGGNIDLAGLGVPV